MIGAVVLALLVCFPFLVWKRAEGKWLGFTQFRGKKVRRLKSQILT